MQKILSPSASLLYIYTYEKQADFSYNSQSGLGPVINYNNLFEIN